MFHFTADSFIKPAGCASLGHIKLYGESESTQKDDYKQASYNLLNWLK